MKWTLRVALQIGLLASLSVAARGGNLLINPGAEAGNLTGWTVGGDSNPGVDNGSFDPGVDPHSGAFRFLWPHWILWHPDPERLARWSPGNLHVAH